MSGYIKHDIWQYDSWCLYGKKKVNWETALLRISGDGWVTIS